MTQIENGKQLLKRDFISGYDYTEESKYPPDNGRSNLCCVCIGVLILFGLIMALLYFFGTLGEKYSSVNAFWETFVRVMEANQNPVIIALIIAGVVLFILYIRYLIKNWPEIRKTWHGFFG